MWCRVIRFGSDHKALAAQAVLFSMLRVVAPIFAIVATIVAWVKLGLVDGSLTAPVTSPLKATLGLGLAMFPGGAWMVARGLLHWVRRRQAQSWPSVQGHVLEPGPAQPFIVVPVLRFWYVVNGHRYDKSVQARLRPAGSEVEVRFDPENPEIGVLAAGDAGVAANVWTGVMGLALPFCLGPLLVWLSN